MCNGAELVPSTSPSTPQMAAMAATGTTTRTPNLKGPLRKPNSGDNSKKNGIHEKNAAEIATIVVPVILCNANLTVLMESANIDAIRLRNVYEAIQDDGRLYALQ